MLTLREAVFGLYAGFGFLRFSPFAANGLDASPAAARTSFRAAWIIVPVSMPVWVLQYNALPIDASLGAFFALKLLGLATAWSAFLVMMHVIAELAERAPRFPAFVTAFNWTAAAKSVVMVPVILVLDILPDEFERTLIVPPVIYVLAVDWFLVRAVLKVPAAAAFGIVMLQHFVMQVLEIAPILPVTAPLPGS